MYVITVFCMGKVVTQNWPGVPDGLHQHAQLPVERRDNRQGPVTVQLVPSVGLPEPVMDCVSCISCLNMTKV